MMRVVDCLDETFSWHCDELARKVVADFQPDVVVGIHRGGAEVAARLAASPHVNCEVVGIRSRRSTTSAKNLTRLNRWAPYLPIGLRNRLRILEHRVGIWRFESQGSTGRSVEVPLYTSEVVSTAQRLLVVDDAVDSGATLAAVVDRLRSIAGAEIKTAALAITFPHPLIVPDYYLHHRGVLLRFPWSSDSRRLG